MAPGLLSYTLIVALAIIVFGRSIGFSIDKFDEETILGPNLKYLTKTATLVDVVQRDAFFRNPGKNFYRPVQNISYWIDARLGRGKPPAFFISSILLHALASCLLFRFLTELTQRRDISLFAALFFAVNPLFAQAICWIPGRGDLLLAVFALTSALAANRFVERGTLRWFAAAAAAIILAIFSKETGTILTVVLPVLLFLNHRSMKGAIRRIGAVTLVAIMASVSLIVLMKLVITDPPEWKSFDVVNLFGNLPAMAEILAKLFVPTLLQPLAGYSTITTIIGVAVLGLVLVLQLRGGDKQDPMMVLFGLMWYLMFMLPGAMYNHRFGSAAYDYLEHRGYAPSIGFFLILIGAFSAVRGILPKRLVSLAAVLMLTFYSGMAYLHVGHYRDALTFYNYAVAANPSSSLALLNRAQNLDEKRDPGGAVRDLREAIARHPEFVSAYVIYGQALFQQGKVDSAITILRRGYAIDPTVPLNALLLGNAFATLNMNDSAVVWYSREIARYPKNFAATINLGVAYSRIGYWDLSTNAFSRAIEINPSNPQAFIFRGLARKEIGQLPEACQDWRTASSLGDARGRELLGQFCQ